MTQAAFAGGADARSAAFVLVVGGDVPDAGVQPNRVGPVSDDGELGAQHLRIADAVQLRPVGFDVA